MCRHESCGSIGTEGHGKQRRRNDRAQHEREMVVDFRNDRAQHEREPRDVSDHLASLLRRLELVTAVTRVRLTVLSCGLITDDTWCEFEAHPIAPTCNCPTQVETGSIEASASGRLINECHEQKLRVHSLYQRFVVGREIRHGCRIHMIGRRAIYVSVRQRVPSQRCSGCLDFGHASAGACPGMNLL